LRARVAALELELEEGDRRIDEMRRECARLQAGQEQAHLRAGSEELEKLFHRLAGTLVNLATLATLAESGQKVEVDDLVRLYRALEKDLNQAGLEAIGRLGESVPFDPATHQGMNCGSLKAGLVTIELPGYRCREKVLRKAMVRAVPAGAAREDNHGTRGA
jgi:molecular chaperone GrpE (heat shock protein)